MRTFELKSERNRNSGIVNVAQSSALSVEYVKFSDNLTVYHYSFERSLSF